MKQSSNPWSLNKHRSAVWCLIAVRSPAELLGRRPSLWQTLKRSTVGQRCLLIGWFHQAISCLHITLLRNYFDFNLNNNWQVLFNIRMLHLPLHSPLSIDAHWFVCVCGSSVKEKQNDSIKSEHVRQCLPQTVWRASFHFKESTCWHLSNVSFYMDIGNNINFIYKKMPISNIV